MAKRKKYPKLPNGYGSIKYLGAGRRNPYAVHPPTTEFTLDGVPKTPKALCYVDDWLKGFAVLTAYKAGTYTPGMEKSLETTLQASDSALLQRILADYSLVKGIEPTAKGKTFKEIFLEYYKDKFKVEYEHKGKKNMESSMTSAFKNCEMLYDKEFALLVANDLQENLDACPLGYSSLENIKTLYHQMYFYAMKNNLCEKDYSKFVVINKEDDENHGIPFSNEELAILWKNKDDPTVEMLLIMCYSGFRITAYRSLETDLKKNYFKGGIKTKTSKNRIVPIHSAIRGLVRRRLARDGAFLTKTNETFRKDMDAALKRIGTSRHTPHDCRHTFSRLCEEYHVQENDRKRMLGHAFDDITNRVYGHRTLEDLRGEIEKIKTP